MNKKILVVAVLLMSLILISNILAITGSIGNARMVLRAQTGDKIEKYILVKNVNNASVNIKISASGDLEKYINIKDKSFSLAAGEEKKAYFTIEVSKEGTTETKINVQFTPEEGKNGVGLASTVIVIAGGEDLSDATDEEGCDGQCDIDNQTNTVDVTTGKITQENKSKITPAMAVLLIITGAIVIIFIVLLIMFFKKNKNKKRPEIAKIKLKKKVKRSA